MPRALLLSTLCGLLALVPGCDFDGAWEGWCARTRCDEVPDAGPASLCGQGLGCPEGQSCMYSHSGGGTCMPDCSGYPQECGPGLDCKLVLSEDQAHVRPVCTAYGTETGVCSSVSDCAELRTCTLGITGYACLEICNPHHSTCELDVPPGADAGEPLPCHHDESMPEGWGVCRR